MRASSRLDVWVISENPVFVPKEEDAVAFVQRLENSRSHHASGSGFGRPVGVEYFGGFAHYRLVREPAVRFVANQQGGFRVFCQGVNVTSEFTHAMRLWREGGDRSLVCPACNTRYPLEALDFRPQAGFYQFALHFSDIQRCELGDAATMQVGALLGSFRLVFRRIG